MKASRALVVAAVGVLLLTVSGIDAIWQLYTNREPSAPADAAATGPWLLVRVALAAVGALLVLGAGWLLWSARDAQEQ